MVEHLGKRPVLTMDQLAEMKNLRVRFEKEVKLPHDTRGSRNRIYFFSIDGTLRGNRFNGCLFAGECMMVQTHKGFEAAHRQAKEGLAETIDIARDYCEKMASALVDVKGNPIIDGLAVEVGGGRSSNVPIQPDLATDPKLKAMIAHKIAGKQWSW